MGRSHCELSTYNLHRPIEDDQMPPSDHEKAEAAIVHHDESELSKLRALREAYGPLKILERRFARVANVKTPIIDSGDLPVNW